MEKSNGKQLIGIVGGMGPAAGLDLASKIVSQTLVSADQDHLPFVLYSFPDEIADRTAFILNQDLASANPGTVSGDSGNGSVNPGKRLKNPGIAIARVLLMMEEAGATVAGMACNSAHAPVIYDCICSGLASNSSKMNLLHIVREVGWHIVYNHAGVRKAGILGTAGTRASGLYHMLNEFGLEIVEVTDDEQNLLHASIYHPDYGIKSTPEGISQKAVGIITDTCQALKKRGAELIVFGCTEFPLAWQAPQIEGMPVVDSSMVLARALVRSASPERLRPFR